jgi:surfactin synthase thioesterase subunit/glycosyltransferase involved in cell wall biosynthesis
MRILLAQNSQYYPAHGGGDKSNRLLIEALAARGHACRVAARAQATFGEEEERRYLDELARRGVRGVRESGTVRFARNGVDVRVATSHPNLRALLGRAISAFEPDVILLSTDDPAQLFLETALQAGCGRLVYLVRTTLALPFGPEGAFLSEEKTERLRRTDGMVAVSRYVAEYIRRWSGIAAEALPISLLEAGPYPKLGRFDNEFVTMVNPCAVKGIAIFLELADAMPEVRFATAPTWGTTAADMEALRRRGNVTILEPVDNIDEILERTRVMLAPSLWAEARGRIVVEAMLRGVPVLASNAGGIPEAMMGMDYLLPVRPIARYARRVDERMVPVAEVPEQDIGPWRRALEELLTDRARYERLSRESRQAALAYAASLSVEPLERFLRNIVAAAPQPRRAAAGAKAQPASRMESLPAEKRALLALRLKKKAALAPEIERWFPALRQQEGARVRLFCFPYAGGGTAVFRGWAERLPSWVAVCPARLPGRESRLAEAPVERIELMVDALAGVLNTELDKPYALFGHSMGAIIAYELARRFEREGRPGPRALLVAAARAPQLRKDHIPGPEPSEEEFLAELRQLGVAAEALENEELRKLVLPALCADSSACRVYSPAPGPPLGCPVRAYAGAGDARLTREAIEAWREQTRSTFRARFFAGGHFFLHTAEAEFLRAVGEDLGEMCG